MYSNAHVVFGSKDGLVVGNLLRLVSKGTKSDNTTCSSHLSVVVENTGSMRDHYRQVPLYHNFGVHISSISNRNSHRYDICGSYTASLCCCGLLQCCGI